MAFIARNPILPVDFSRFCDCRHLTLKCYNSTNTASFVTKFYHLTKQTLKNNLAPKINPNSKLHFFTLWYPGLLTLMESLIRKREERKRQEKRKSLNLQSIKTHDRQIASPIRYFLARLNCWSEAGALHL